MCRRGLGDIWERPCPLSIPLLSPLRPQNPAHGAESLASDSGLLFRRVRAALPWRPRPASPSPSQSPSHRAARRLPLAPGAAGEIIWVSPTEAQGPLEAVPCTTAQQGGGGLERRLTVERARGGGQLLKVIHTWVWAVTWLS